MSQNLTKSNGMKLKQIIFCIAAVMAVICMFQNWLVIDLNLGYIRLDDIAEDINVFTLPGMLGEIEDALSPFAGLLPKELTNGLGVAVFFSYMSMVLAICGIVCYSLSVVWHIAGKDNAGKFGGLAAGLVLLSSMIFVVMVTTVMDKMVGEDYASSVLGDVIGGPCGLAMLGAVVSAATAAKGSMVGKDWGRNYTKRIDCAIEEHPHDPETEWVCSSCMTVNRQEKRFCKCGCGVGLK